MYLRFSAFSNNIREGNSLEDNGIADVAIRFPWDRNFLSLIDSSLADDSSSMGTWGAKDLDLNFFPCKIGCGIDSKSDKKCLLLLGGVTIMGGVQASFDVDILKVLKMLWFERLTLFAGKLCVLRTKAWGL